MIDSYDNQRDMKLHLDILVNNLRAKRKGVGSPPSESGLSVRSAKSEKSYVSSRNSVKEMKSDRRSQVRNGNPEKKTRSPMRIRTSRKRKSRVDQEDGVIKCQN